MCLLVSVHYVAVLCTMQVTRHNERLPVINLVKRIVCKHQTYICSFDAAPLVPGPVV